MHATDEPIKMIQQGAAKWQFCQFARWEIDVISNDKQWNTSGLFAKRPHHLQLLVQVLKASAIFAFLWLFAQDWEKG